MWSQTFTLSYATSYSGVTNMPDNVTGITSGTGVTVSSIVPAKQGYTFVGWSRTDGGSATLFGGSNVYVTADVTLWTVFEKSAIDLFYWDSASTDANLIAAGQPISNMTASRWNRFKAKIAELAAAEGDSYRYSTVASSDTFYATEFNEVRSAIMNRSGYGTLPAAQPSGNEVKASLFESSGSLKTALNAAITHYNNS